MTMARIVILNGVSSVGKSSIARALQTLAAEPILNVSGDAFLSMLPPRLWGQPDGIIVTQQQTNGTPFIEVEMGTRVESLMCGMRAAVAALARAGNSCIVDDVMLTPADQGAYLEWAGLIPLHFVGLHAPLAVLEERERQRGDRLLGLARWQSSRVHKGMQYDFELDTSERSPAECAKAIGLALNLGLAE